MTDLHQRISGMVEKANTHGRNTAEITILADPLPWSREHFAEMADRMADHWICGLAEFCKVDDDDATTEVIIRIAASARQGFIERIAELKRAGANEGGVQ